MQVMDDFRPWTFRRLAGIVAGLAVHALFAVTVVHLFRFLCGRPPQPGNAWLPGNALLALQNQNIVAGETPLNYYSGVVFGIGNDVQSAQSNEQTGSAVLTQLQNLQGGVSGVDVNEESANLIRYQTAYQASAQVSAVIDQLLQTTITTFVP